MKLAALVLPLLLLGAAPAVPDVQVGRFQVWGARSAATLRFRSGGLVITVGALPCPARPPRTEGCAIEGVNNQARITVAAPGIAPISVTSDRQASFVRVAAVRLDRRSAPPGVVIDNQWGGSAGLTAVTVIEPVSQGFRAVPLRTRSGQTELVGQIADRPRDRSGDGVVDLVLEDARVGGFGCNACSPRPPLVLSVVGGRSVDLSARRSVRPVFAADIVHVRAMCRSRHADRNGNCAAYLADAARLGRFESGWRDMLAHYERRRRLDLWQGCTVEAPDGKCPADKRTDYRGFPESVRAMLVHAAYISEAQAAAVPLS